ncbi:MAG: hypothetical protein HYU80_01820 [Candidatus Blackburnbacteria bacterium]|nr:hypothetical protein [Candidatus Blackburnbacteria bacterium]
MKISEIFIKFQNPLLLAIVSLAGIMALWLPFILNIPTIWGIKLNQEGMATIIRNYDGPYYIVAAKTLYNPEQIENNFSFPLPSIYYSAHYPLFPLLIRSVTTAFPFMGYPYAMITVTVVTSILAVWMFYFLLEDIGLQKHSLWLATLFSFFPARWLITRSIGSPEPLFLLVIMASIFFFRKNNFWLAALFGILAQWTKPPAILLFFSYTVAIIVSSWNQLALTNAAAWVKKLPWKSYPLLLIPLSLVGLYFWYGKQYGNFFAYFNSGDNVHLMFPPFQIFNPKQTWVGTFWLEEVIWIYLFAAVGVVYLIKQKQIAIASFVGIFFLSLLFVSHRDIARYSLPIIPFLFIAFHKVLESPEFKWISLLLLLPIYLFSITFITNNVTPIADWGPLL